MTAPRTTESTEEAPCAHIGTVTAPDPARALAALAHVHAEEHAAAGRVRQGHERADLEQPDQEGPDHERAESAAWGRSAGERRAASRAGQGRNSARPGLTPAEDRHCPPAAEPGPQGPEALVGARSGEGRPGPEAVAAGAVEGDGGVRSGDGGPGPEAPAGTQAAEGDGGRTAVPGGLPRDGLSGRRGSEPVARRGAADPVKALMHRHRELCERAVDPLEIAAGLEAHGVTDRTAARFRHRDVFALAEEMYARVPWATEHTPAPVRPACAADSRAGRTGSAPWLLRALLPGAVCALAVVGMEAAEGTLRLLAGAAGAVGVAVATALCLRRGPLRAKGRTVASVRTWTLCLLAFAAFGQGLVHEVITGGPDRAWPMDTTPLVALALAVAPAACCAHLYSVLARRRLERCRGLDEFAAGARPLLLSVLVLHTGALTVVLTLTGLVLPGGSPVPTAALGTLLFLARLFVVHGFPESAATALAAACAVEAAAPALLLAGRLPGLEALARPVDALVGAWGTAAVPALACGAAAAGLLAHAAVALSRASAHTP